MRPADCWRVSMRCRSLGRLCCLGWGWLCLGGGRGPGSEDGVASDKMNPTRTCRLHDLQKREGGSHPRESRRRLSQKLCEAWQWKQPNGALRDMVCRGLLLALDRGGQIELPPVRYVP